MQNKAKTDMPKVSVIIPCYNAKKTIEGCLNGLLAQDYPDYEIIVVDDNSNDGVIEILKVMPGIKLIRNKTNRGPAYARNVAIEASTGEIIFMLDSDCLIEDKGLISKHALAHRDPSVHILGGGIQGIGNGYVAKADNYCHWVLNIPYSDDKVGTHLVTNNMSVKRSVFEKVGYFDPRFRTGEDTDFCERAIKAGYKLNLRTDAVVKHHDREKLKDFLRCFYLAGIDRIPTRRLARHRYWYLLPFGFSSSLVYCIPLSVLLTVRTLHAWLPHDKKVIFYTPLIFMGKFAMAAGIVHYCFINNFLVKKTAGLKNKTNK